MYRTVYHANDNTKEFFFSTNHCQENTPDGFVPVSTIYDKQAVIEYKESIGYVEIPNPDKKYQA